MEKRIKLQIGRKTLMQNALRNYKKDSKDRKTESYFANRIAMLKKNWTEFEEAHLDIISDIDDETELEREYFKLDVYSEVEELFISICSKFEEDHAELYSRKGEGPSKESKGTSVNKNEELKLPRIQIPKFSGGYQNWPSFRDLFETSIHNCNTISNVHKLQLLKSNLTGEAESLLRHFSVTNANYLMAWNVLNDRYNNKRVLVDNQLKVLCSQRNITRESSLELRNLLDTTSECIHALSNLKIEVESWDAMIVYIVVQKLPSESHQLWEQNLNGSKEIPTWSQLREFLELRFRTLEAMADKRSSPIVNRIQHQVKNKFTHSFHVFSKNNCIVCSEQHNIRNCPKVVAMDQASRLKEVKSHGLCFNCLGKGHGSVNCPSKYRCSACNQRHHTLLHREERRQVESSATKNRIAVPLIESRTYAMNCTTTVVPQERVEVQYNQSQLRSKGTRTSGINSNTSGRQVLLATALVRVRTREDEFIILRALIDQGSQASFITEEAVQRLKLKKMPISAIVNGLGEAKSSRVNSKVEFTLSPLHRNTISIHVEGFVLKRITNCLPVQNLYHEQWSHIEGLLLADPRYNVSSRIDLLLGAEVFSQIIVPGVSKGPPGTPVAQETLLGWILSGEVNGKSDKRFEIQGFHSNIELSQQLKRFWEIEEVNENKILSEEESQCEKLFRRDNKRLPDGRYEVRIPFKEENPRLGKSKDIAVSRLLQMEARFKRDPELFKQYSMCLKEYLELDHMREINAGIKDTDVTLVDESNSFQSCYLPHHAVIKQSSSTTKLRVVFDASQKTSSGYSLNEMMLNGPVLQDDLTSLLVRWRMYKIGFMADAEKMYRQIRMNPEHTKYQKIVWRENPDCPIQEYELTTITFGTRSAPYLAIRTMHQLAMDEEEKYPVGAEAIKNDMYVDDLISGAHNVKDALLKQKEIINIMKAGGFNMRKWASNYNEVVETVLSAEREIEVPLNLENTDCIKALGIKWNPSIDSFSYTIKIESREKITKRTVLSDISKLFDPLGWLVPVIITSKVMLQDLWLMGTAWDESLPAEFVSKWLSYHKNLKDIEKMKIPRWFGYTDAIQSVEMHGFSDASLKAYAAVVYICVVENGSRKTTILSARSKVAPIKTISLPRLELCGAELLAKLMRRLIKAIKIPDIKIFTWTDSEIVLAWLRGHPSKWKQFIGNRVSNIIQLLEETSWRYVPSKQNPADVATRGITPSELTSCELWWNGPDWLRAEESYWPLQKKIVTTELEAKKIVLVNITEEENWCLLDKFSSFSKLCRVTAYCFRFIRNLKTPEEERSTSYLKSAEIQEAEKFWIKYIQNRYFHDEINSLKKNENIWSYSKKSQLQKLTPFVHTDGLLRIRGRLEFSMLKFEEKHPIVLPQRSRLTELIVWKTHLDTLHGGNQLTMAVLMKRFWIIRCKEVVKSCIYKCIVCHRQKMIIRKQLMGNLPIARVRPSRPFTHTGVDYCGPFDIRMSKGRGSKSYKGYIAIFVCFATKAIHIEVVSDMTSTAFLAAFRRFVSRRGLCSDIYSDCGSNFVGANVILTKQKTKMVSSLTTEVAAAIENEGVKWHFIPPASPNFGGLWEAGVKSIKHHLKRIAGQSRLTYEEFSTLATQIEACLNSRPICEITQDPNDLRPLTPGHFLIGDSLLSAPEAIEDGIMLHALERWNLIQQMLHSFWSRWSTEYLSRLQQRPKWYKMEENLRKGDLVLVKDERLPPTRWLMARIINVHPGDDKLIRVVTIKTKDGILKRSISKICRLPIKSENVEEKENHEML